jgi:N-acetylmuramoyl-L-alanine amidase
MNKSLIIIVWLLVAVMPAGANDGKFVFEKYYEVTAEKGDGIYSLLRKYGLDGYSCNFQQFYELNKLKKNAPLFIGKTYTLPILVYRFNGNTIRSTIGIDNWDLALRIQEYNEQMFEAQVKPAPFKTDKELWVPFHELNCPDADLKIPQLEKQPAEPETGEITAAMTTMSTTAGKRNFPIFGPQLAYTPLSSNKLKGKVFYVVSGHGGPDPGAMGKQGKNKLCEDEYAYDVALRLCRNLIAHGATAYMINRDANDGIRSGKYLDCDEDEVLWGNIAMVASQRERLFQRSNIVNALYESNAKKGVTDQKMIVIHVDSRTRGKQIDLFFYYKPGDQKGKQFAAQMQKTMKKKYSRYRDYHGTISPRSLHMLRETQPTSIYIELGNIRNSRDQQRILLEGNRQALANWLFEGLLNSATP